MGRLIDEDDVMHMLTGVELNNGTFTGAKTELRNVKTAYSVEKVVAELKKASTIYEMSEDNIKCAIEEKLAVHIVRNGGIL